MSRARPSRPPRSGRLATSGWPSVGCAVGWSTSPTRTELTPSQLSVLSRLGKEGPASASDLAAAERIRPQSVAATLAVLEERALVIRRPDPGDGRRQLVSLSPAGTALFDDRRRHREEWLSRALEERLTESERQTVIDAAALLERLTHP